MEYGKPWMRITVNAIAFSNCTSVLTRALAWFTDMSCAEHAEKEAKCGLESQVLFIVDCPCNSQTLIF